MQFARRAFVCWLLLLWRDEIGAVIHSKDVAAHFNHNHHYHHGGGDFTIHKVSFTQKGYIQFLRYINDVPPLTEYTFCIWMRSNNLTYSHPLLSYSKHEEERLIRVWISPGGLDVNLEILERHVFKVPTNFVENRWYHVCQSWSSHQAAWNLYVNGKLKSGGFVPELKGITIKGGGDIVVGQEYTDFDKGLDDGIEGDVFGFNFVLSPTSHYAKHAARRHFDEPPPFYHTLPLELYREGPQAAAAAADDVPGVLGYFSVPPNRQPKGFMDFVNSVFGVYRRPAAAVKVRVADDGHFGRKQIGARIVNDIDDFAPKPLGLRLVELGYKCYLGKGAPVSGRNVLISWTKSPVRVFGGAILKSIQPFCTSANLFNNNLI